MSIDVACISRGIGIAGGRGNLPRYLPLHLRTPTLPPSCSASCSCPSAFPPAPLVRRAVTSVIGDLATAGGSAVACWTVQLLEKSTADSHDIVRIFAVKGCITLATTLRHLLLSDDSILQEEADQKLHLLYCQMVPMVNTYISVHPGSAYFSTVASACYICSCTLSWAPLQPI